MALITYDNRKLDRDAFKKKALDPASYAAWLNSLGVKPSNQTRDAWDLVAPFIESLDADEAAYGTPSKWVFAGADDFLKAHNKKRAYNASAYLSYLASQFPTYEEPKPTKTKLSREIIGKELINALGDISGLTDAYKLLALKDAWQKVIDKYKWELPDLYELPEGETLAGYKTSLDRGISAFGTPDTADDAYAYWGIGVTNPNKPKVDSFIEKARKLWLDENYGNAEEFDTLIPKIKEANKNKFLASLGIDTNKPVITPTEDTKKDVVEEVKKATEEVKKTPTESTSKLEYSDVVAPTETSKIDQTVEEDEEASAVATMYDPNVSISSEALNKYLENHSIESLDGNAAFDKKVIEGIELGKIKTKPLGRTKFEIVAIKGTTMYLYDRDLGKMVVRTKTGVKKDKKGGYLKILNQYKYGRINNE